MHRGIPLAILLTACNGGGTDSDTDKNTTTSPDEWILDASAELVPDQFSVVKVTWNTPQDASSYVEYGSPECDHTSPTTTGTAHEQLLMGLPGVSDACWRIVVDTKDGLVTGEDQSIATGAPPQGSISATISDDDPSQYELEYVVGGAVLPSEGFVMNRKGQLVWATLLGSDRNLTDMEQLADRSGFTFNDYPADRSITDDSNAHFHNNDGTVTSVRNMPAGHHAYQVLPDGRFVYLQALTKELTYTNKQGKPETGTVVYDVLRELNADDTEGTIIWDTSTDEAKFPLVEDSDNSGFYPQGVDWTHADYFSYDAARDSFIVSFRNINSVIEVDQSGNWKRSFGEHGEYKLMEGGAELDWETLIGWPHNTVATADDTYLVMTNPADPSSGAGRGDLESLILEIGFDDTAKTATILQRLGTGRGHFAQIEGNATRLGNGNTLIDWGAAGVMEEVNASDEVVWKASFGLGYFVGHVHPLESFYP